VVDADGNYLILGTRVSPWASDRNELVADVQTIPEVWGRPAVVLADNDYADREEVQNLEDEPIEVMVATGTGRGRRNNFRPIWHAKTPNEPQAAWLKRMQAHAGHPRLLNVDYFVWSA
jgi:hypothetical protein